MRAWWCVLFLAGPAWAKETAEAPKAVTLTYGWQAGWKGKDTTTTTREVTEGNHTQKQEITTGSRFEVGTAADGLAVRWRDPTFSIRRWENGQPVTPSPVEVAVLQSLAGMQMGWVVNAEGAIVGLDGEDATPDGFSRVWDAATAEGAARLPPTERSEFEDAMAAVREAHPPERYLKDMQELQWWQVGFWAGSELQVGASYETKREGPGPQGDPIVVTTTFRAAGFEPCTTKKRSPTCVNLQAVVTSTTTVVPEGIDPDAAKSDGAPPSITVTFLTAYNIITEPATLRAWRYAEIETVRAMNTETSELLRTEEDILTSTFAWSR